MNEDAVVEKLVNENISLAYFMVKKYADAYRLDEADALSIAMHAMMSAAKKFDFKVGGASFGTFAGYIIRQEFGAAKLRATRQKRGGGTEDLRLDSPMAEGSDDTVADSIGDGKYPPNELLSLRECWDIIRPALSALNKRELTIIRAKFNLDNDQWVKNRELGELLGVSRERVRQIEEVALSKLRKLLD